MKKLFGLLGAAALLAAVTTQAQPANIGQWLQDGGQLLMTSTNWAVVGGGGRGLTGNKNVYFGGLAYNFTDFVGAYVGGDYLTSPGGNVAEVVKGGVTLQIPIYPFRLIGVNFATNFQVSPFADELLATPRQGNVPVGNIIGGGVNIKVATLGRWGFDAGVEVNNRTGQGYWNGNYLTGHAAIGRDLGNIANGTAKPVAMKLFNVIPIHRSES